MDYYDPNLTSANLAEADPELALRLQVAHLQHLVTELLRKNQELRQALAKAGAGPSTQS